MTTTVEPIVEWSQDQMVEIILNEPDDFLKVRETLTRIGVASRKEKKLYQSCHILHKQGRYYIVHFKELFALDGKHANLTVNDVQRRNRIIRLLFDWSLITVINPDKVSDIALLIFDFQQLPYMLLEDCEVLVRPSYKYFLGIYKIQDTKKRGRAKTQPLFRVFRLL